VTGVREDPHREHVSRAVTGFALFPTAIGHCAVAWGERGICAMQLPDVSEAALRERMRRRHAVAVEGTPPPEVRTAMELVTALLDGADVDLSRIPLDMGGVPPFHRRVYEITQAIPRGQTLTYGEVAARLDDPGAARAVGQALGANPFAPIVPCHRVVAAGAKLGGFSARGGLTTKLRMLGIEGARITEAQTPDLFD
jgi:methylated-DNA-[protein]-cysteine S-methyltransferase